MAISDQLTKLSDDIKATYTAVENKGGTIPTAKNTDNLPDAVSSIPTGGGGSGEFITDAQCDELGFSAGTAEAINTNVFDSLQITDEDVAFAKRFTLNSAKSGFLFDGKSGVRVVTPALAKVKILPALSDYNYQSSGVVNSISRCTSLRFLGDITSTSAVAHSFMSFRTLVGVRSVNLPNTAISSLTRLFESSASLEYIGEINVAGTVTDMSYMFQNCSALTSIPQLDTSSCTNMSSMFSVCYSLTSIPQLDTSSCTNMSSMFQNCSSLTSIPQLDTSSCTDMSYMFQNCQSLTSIPQLDTSSCTNMSSMFQNCQSLTSIPQLDTSSCTNMSSMFSVCYSLTSIPQLDTSSCKNMTSMFQNCQSLTSITLTGENNTSLSNLSSMFRDCASLTYLDISPIHLENITSYGYMLAGVPTTCQIIVRDQASLDWITAKFPSYTNVSIKEA